MSPLEEFMRSIRNAKSNAPVVTHFVQCNKSALDDVDITPGQWIFCADTKDYYVDTKNGVRNKVSDVIFVDSEEDRTDLISPLNDKLYITRDTGTGWLYLDDEWVPLHTKASSVYTSDGHTVEDKLAGISKIGRRTGRTVATSDGQTQFTIPFPFQNYLAAGNYVEVLIDSKLIDETLYSISGDTLTVDQSLALNTNEVVRFIFWYNDYSGSAYNPDSVTLPASNVYLANGMTLQQAVMVLMDEVSTHKSIAQNVVDLTKSDSTEETNDSESDTE